MRNWIRAKLVYWLAPDLTEHIYALGYRDALKDVQDSLVGQEQITLSGVNYIIDKIREEEI